jgi:DNA-binding response OmpR family regulator
MSPGDRDAAHSGRPSAVREGRARAVLVVEDDEDLRLVLGDNLEAEGYEVTLVRSAKEAREALGQTGFELVVLDLMLPDGDGYSICRELRKARRNERVLMLTARSLEDDVVNGFAAGADDYVLKPYRLRELLARVAALLRRPSNDAARRLAFAGYVLDLDARAVSDAQGRPVVLTRTEFDLLATLLEHSGVARSRDQLIDAAWGPDVMVDPRTVDNFVAALKKKLGWTADSAWRLVALRGVGYRFEVD